MFQGFAFQRALYGYNSTENAKTLQLPEPNEMLSYSLLKNHAGILLASDYNSLKALHEVVHEVNERSPLWKDKEGMFLGLAYDVRKAYEGQRKTIQPPEHFPEIGPNFGVEVLWPVILVQSRMLRASLAFIDSTKRHQAIAYNLEAVIEDALREAFGPNAPVLIEQWERINPCHPWPEAKLGSRAAAYCSMTKAERREHLVDLLASLDPMYPIIYKLTQRKPSLSPEELDAWEGLEWADPRW